MFGGERLAQLLQRAVQAHGDVVGRQVSDLGDLRVGPAECYEMEHFQLALA